jgi:hypothetical protein
VPGYTREMAPKLRRSEVAECRRCGTYCDRVIRPSTCVAAGCPALYQYDDELTGRRYMGCLHKVFSVEIDVELFEQAERTRLGFGAVKLAGPPLRRCQFAIEQAFPPRPGAQCVNIRFFDLPDAAPDAVRAFDLRDRL